MYEKEKNRQEKDVKKKVCGLKKQKKKIKHTCTGDLLKASGKEPKKKLLKKK